MKKFLSLALAVLMLAVMLPVTALAAGPSGSIDSANITHAGGNLKNAVSLELKGVTFTESVAVKLYSGDTLLTTATLQGVAPSSYGFLTCCIATQTADKYWSLSCLSMDTKRVRRTSRLMPMSGQPCPALRSPIAAASSAPA